MDAEELSEYLHREIVGQNEAIEAVVRTVIVAETGISDPQRPLGTFLFAGPTGVGKSQLGRSLAKILHGEERTAVVINCTEFKNPHDVAKLTGAPPGYVGHEQPPFLTPEKLSPRFTVVIFEELEKADRSLPDLLLQILERGELKTGRGVDLSFTNCFIFMTSNVGAREADRASRGGMGFGLKTAVITPEDAQSHNVGVFMTAIKDFFSPEFINRIDDIVVFNRLQADQMLVILDKFMLDIRARCAMAGVGTMITDAAKKFLIEAGTNVRYGARPLRQALRKYLEFPLANLINRYKKTMGVMDGQLVIRVDYDSKERKLSFQTEKTQLRSALFAS